MQLAGGGGGHESAPAIEVRAIILWIAGAPVMSRPRDPKSEGSGNANDNARKRRSLRSPAWLVISSRAYESPSDSSTATAASANCMRATCDAMIKTNTGKISGNSCVMSKRLAGKAEGKTGDCCEVSRHRLAVSRGTSQGTPQTTSNHAALIMFGGPKTM